MKSSEWITVAACLCISSVGWAEVNIQYVTVGDPCNAPDTHGEGYGRVDYVYRIGKYEVTAGQYCEFLNAVAAEDTHGLYNEQMWDYLYGCKIRRSGAEGSYTYDIPDPQRVNRPVSSVSFWDACRFANWLHNGQPGLDSPVAQDVNSTEDGAYFLNGVTNPTNTSISREPDAKVWIPSEDEWYKAAYYDPAKPGGPGYWEFPTRSNAPPTAELPPGTDDANGSANYYEGHFAILDPTYGATQVGAYDSRFSDSAWGTFDQGGNVWEWNETIFAPNGRGQRGGTYGGYCLDGTLDLAAACRYFFYATHECFSKGFRVAEVPEPATLTLMIFGSMLVVRRRRP